MAILEHVEVRIKLTSNDTYLPEYDTPNEHFKSSETTVEKYIEAQTDAKFEVEIRIDPKFRWHGAKALRIILRLDGGSLLSHSWYHDKKSLGELPFVRVINKMKFRQPNGFSKTNFSFSSIAIDESLDIGSAELAKTAAKMGLIQVQIIRLKELHYLGRAELGAPKKGSALTKGPKELLKDAHISHSVKLCNEVPSTPFGEWIHSPLSNIHGKPLTFNFRYRSRFCLDVLGILKMTPPPEIPQEPEDRPTIENSTQAPMTQEEMQAALTRLQAENEVLRKQVKKEETEIKAEPYNRRLPEIQPAEGGPMRKRRKVVDLTEDE
ncbi:hypothetical protein L228DRAFT_249210 [Xylona heveae TC161]|uniref:DUF7918 domain-containing protein n=1 Tax=Xylona heveae (strain CBS 132557 / TC161) TaxID=1328760 RepID=A0A165FUI7_XYLHT|nr:hypothetical protein L228DRAFT_249210 [Xylona heveae TC161]KZF21398.1 hypothetical protein L228DRAFT_249210 [Xylona heveae TC161]